MLEPASDLRGLIVRLLGSDAVKFALWLFVSRAAASSIDNSYAAKAPKRITLWRESSISRLFGKDGEDAVNSDWSLTRYGSGPKRS